MPRARKLDPDAGRFGAIVRSLREEKGWTLQKLATRSDMNARYLSILEQGGNIPSLSTALELLEVLGADTAAVIGQLAEARTRPGRAAK